MRMLVTGSRDWTDINRLCREIIWFATVSQNVTLVHGACPTGADDIADDFGTTHGWTIERHPADWGRHGRRAGFVRNAAMVSAGAEVCLAFIKNKSSGATMCADLAEKAGIPTHRFTEDG